MITIGTHDGKFHADEVFACALIILCHLSVVTVIRTRDRAKLNGCDFVVDVGGEYDPSRGRFDHHQPSFTEQRTDGTPYSSFGLVWRAFGGEFLGDDTAPALAERIERELVVGIDARDNGLMPERRPLDAPSVADMITAMNPTWEEGTVSGDEHFALAVELAKSFLLLLRKNLFAECAATEVVRQAIAQSHAADDRLVTLDVGCPWQATVVPEAPSALYVLYPSNDDSEWFLQAVPQSLGAQAVRRKVPAAWHGKSGAEITGLTGVADVKFAPKAGYLAITKTQEAALALSVLALANEE